jgi:hypothetical protein
MSVLMSSRRDHKVQYVLPISLSGWIRSACNLRCDVDLIHRSVYEPSFTGPLHQYPRCNAKFSAIW